MDLEKRTVSEEAVPEKIYREYLGGKGLGAYLLVEKNPVGVDPLSPDNKFIIATGPACGFTIWGANRYGVFTKSPLTGIFSESYSGGKAFLPISRIGYDAVVLDKSCDDWTYLEFRNGNITYHDASFLMGKDSFVTEDILGEKYRGRRLRYLQ